MTSIAFCRKRKLLKFFEKYSIISSQEIFDSYLHNERVAIVEDNTGSRQIKTFNFQSEENFSNALVIKFNSLAEKAKELETAILTFISCFEEDRETYVNYTFGDFIETKNKIILPYATMVKQVYTVDFETPIREKKSA